MKNDKNVDKKETKKRKAEREAKQTKQNYSWIVMKMETKNAS